MTNERLGIYEELRAKSKQYERKRALHIGTAYNGAYSQPTNPFVPPLPTPTVPLAVQVKKREGGYYHQHPHRKRGGQRKIWPESELGVNIGQILQAVCIEADLTYEDMSCVARSRRFAWPRHVAMYMIDRYCPSYALTEIAKLFRRDHTTVMHGIMVTSERLLDGDIRTTTLVANVHQRLASIAEGSA